ncbi:MAG TPA: pentapeptide repeat-containing protein, partial [Phormidium sp.]
MIEPEKDLMALISKIEQLEERQNITAKYAVGVKRQLDELTEKFNHLQQRFEQPSDLNKELNAITSIKEVEHIEIVVIESESDNVESTTLSKLIEIEGNDNNDKLDLNQCYLDVDVAKFNPTEKANSVVQHKLVTVLSNEEFLIERMLLLLMRDDILYELSLKSSISSEKFLEQYNNKVTDFTEINLTGVNLSGVNLSRNVAYDLVLRGANLQRAELYEANLSGSKIHCGYGAYQFHKTVLIEANLNNANLHKIKLYGANLEKATLEKANLSEADLRAVCLCNANLSKANLRLAVCEEVNFSGANLNGADLTNANLSKANLRLAVCEEVNFSGANLNGADLT